MPFSLPDKGEGANDVQSILFQEYLDVLIAGLSGTDYVVNGCAVTAQGAPDMTVAVAVGFACSAGKFFTITAGNVTVTAADGTNPRLDLIVVNNAGTKAIRTGTPGANPKPAARSANDVVLAVVYVPAADTTIAANQITDLRIIRDKLARCVALLSDHANSTVTGTEVTGLGPMTLEPGTYTFTFSLLCQSGTATTGLGLGINFTGTATRQAAAMRFVSTAAATITVTTATTGVVDDVANSNTGQSVEGYATRTFSTTSPNMVFAGVATISVDCLVIIEGVIVVTATGDLELWHSSETAVATTVKAGSSVVVQNTS